MMEAVLSPEKSDNKLTEGEISRNCNRSSLRWVNTSEEHIGNAQDRLFKAVKNVEIKNSFVPVSFENSSIYTVTVKGTVVHPNYEERIPLVLVHGFGGGIGLWMHNLESLCSTRPVYAFDLLGFGRSSRPKFSSDAGIVESEWISSIEDWRKAMKIDKMILLGHSLGGFLSSAYALKHHERVDHLILADPWGFPEKPSQEVINQIPLRYRILGRVATKFNPLAGVRAAGPWGRSLVEKLRPDLGQRYALTDDDKHKSAFFDYLYHCNAQTPSGERAYKKMTTSLIWAQRPMIDRLLELHKDVPVTFIYGSETWIERRQSGKKSGYQLQDQAEENQFIHVEEIDGAGHHVYADDPETFNQIVNRILST